MSPFTRLITSLLSGPIQALGRMIAQAGRTAQTGSQARSGRNNAGGATGFSRGRSALIGGLVGMAIGRGGAAGAMGSVGLGGLAKAATSTAAALMLLQRAAKTRAAATGVGQSSLTSLATNPRNFGNLLSGKVQPQQLMQQNTAHRARLAAGQAGVARTAAGLGALKALGVAAGAAVTALVAIPLAGKAFAESLVESSRGMAKFNGQIGLAYASLDRDRLIRSRMSGAATAGSTETLVQAVSDMEEELRPIKDAATNLKNEVGAGFAILITGVTKLIGIGEWFRSMHPKNLFNKPPQSNWEELMSSLAGRGRERRKQQQRGGRDA